MTKREEFNETVRKMVGEMAGEDVTVTLNHVLKLNGVVQTGIMLQRDGSNAAATCYVDQYYDENGDLEEMAKRAAGSVVRAYESPEGSACDGIDLSYFNDYEKVRDKVCYRLINADKNRKLLPGIPHVPYLDLAVCFYLGVDLGKAGRGTILVTNVHAERWGVDAARLMADAKRNTKAICGTFLTPMEEILMEGMTGVPARNCAEDFKRSGLHMYVLTNDERSLGSAAMLYEGQLERIRESMGDYYVIPSSIHELLLVSGAPGGDAGHLKTIVEEVNAVNVEEKDYLSDSVYYFDGELKKCA